MPTFDKNLLEYLRCPETGEPLRLENEGLVRETDAKVYPVTETGIPLFAEQFLSDDARAQQEHYDHISIKYLEHLDYPHTKAYQEFMDSVLLDAASGAGMGAVAEICCGGGEAFKLLGNRVEYGIGVDISRNMLESARDSLDPEHFQVVQGDATSLPLKDARFDSVFMLGGIHHVNDRLGLFREVRRILKPGGTFYWREPVSDFLLWRLLRAIIYRLSPELDYDTESPLRYDDTVPVLKDAGLKLDSWRTLGFFGACFLLNSDVLVFNRLFRFIPGIRGLTKFAAGVDEWTLQLPGLRRAGLQVIGSAHRL